MIIQFDVDGVLANFLSGYRKLAVEMFKIPDEQLPAEQTRWDNDPAGLNTDQIDRIWNRIKQDPLFWYRLPLQATWVDMDRIDKLTYEHDVYFVTSRIGVSAKRQTEDWLSAYGIETPTVLISSQKGQMAKALKATHVIDDKAGNCVYGAYEWPSALWYCYDAPYNRFDGSVLGSKVKRVSTVTEFLNILEVLEGS